jgi:hypothetical protein
MTRHLRLVAEGGNLVEPQPAAPTPKISVDAALVDLVIDVLDRLLLATRAAAPTRPPAPRRGVSSNGHPKPSKPTKTKGAQPS